MSKKSLRNRQRTFTKKVQVPEKNEYILASSHIPLHPQFNAPHECDECHEPEATWCTMCHLHPLDVMQEEDDTYEATRREQALVGVVEHSTTRLCESCHIGLLKAIIPPEKYLEKTGQAYIGSLFVEQRARFSTLLAPDQRLATVIGPLDLVMSYAEILYGVNHLDSPQE